MYIDNYIQVYICLLASECITYSRQMVANVKVRSLQVLRTSQNTRLMVQRV